MKILTLVFVFLSFLLSADGQTVIFGMDTSATAGMSYKNPAIGGFADLRWQKSRLVSVNMIELTNDQKVFEPNGSTLRGRTEIGMLITPTIAVTGLMGFSRHTNVDYTKTALSPGVGLRKYFGKGFQTYARYAFPDATSPNEVSSIGGGWSSLFHQEKDLVYIGGSPNHSRDSFSQTNQTEAVMALVFRQKSASGFLAQESNQTLLPQRSRDTLTRPFLFFMGSFYKFFPIYFC